MKVLVFITTGFIGTQALYHPVPEAVNNQPVRIDNTGQTVIFFLTFL